MSRKILRVIGFVILIVIVFVVLIQLIPYGRNHTNPQVVSNPKWESPQTRALAKRACFDCHSNETVWPWYSNIAPVSWLVYRDVVEGRRKLNFSDLRPGSDESLREIAEVISDGEMPPLQYLLLRPSAMLSTNEKTQLVNGLLKTFGQ